MSNMMRSTALTATLFGMLRGLEELDLPKKPEETVEL